MAVSSVVDIVIVVVVGGSGRGGVASGLFLEMYTFFTKMHLHNL